MAVGAIISSGWWATGTLPMCCSVVVVCASGVSWFTICLPLWLE